MAGIRFLELLAEDVMAFDSLYCVAFQMMDAQWLAKRASYMEFNVILFSKAICCLSISYISLFIILSLYCSSYWTLLFQDVLASTRLQLERELALEDVYSVKDLPAYNLLRG